MSSLLEQLEQKRRQIAQRESKEEYMVFPYPTLNATARAAPKTKGDLAKIKGWGPKRIEKYGDEILEILNNPEKQAETENDPEMNQDYVTVKQFIRQINKTLASVGRVKIRGEISELNIVNDNAYIVLKDPEGDAILSCFLGRWRIERYKHLLEAGMEVVIQGVPNVYEKLGKFTLMIDTMEPIGEGALKKAFEALKKKLEEKGYFDPERKRPIPDFVEHIGLITSAQGEAVNDFKKNLGNHGFKVYLIDVRVEGKYAEKSIVSALGEMSKHPDLDVVALIRGGGGLENLKAFSSVSIAEAIVSSRVPVITGIGHERDESISDYVADRKFSTPTAVAVFLKTQRENFIQKTEELAETSLFHMDSIIKSAEREVSTKTEQLESKFQRLLENYKFAIIRQSEKMENCLAKVFERFRRLENSFLKNIYAHENRIQNTSHKLETWGRSMSQSLESKLELLNSKIKSAESSLIPLNPRAVLGRGYSVVFNKHGSVIKEARDVKVGDNISIALHRGALESTVKKVSDRLLNQQPS